MNPAEIIEQVTADGIALSVSPDGNLKIIGDQEKIEAWLEVIRENKPAILSELWHQQFMAESDRKYSILVTDTSTDPVLVKVGIKGIGTFDMAIPKAHYDGVALLDVLEQYSQEWNERQRNVA